MNQDEVIEPSDSEEREELCADTEEYWRTVASRINQGIASIGLHRKRDDALPRLEEAQGVGEAAEGEGKSPPKKRMKFFHESKDTNSQEKTKMLQESRTGNTPNDSSSRSSSVLSYEPQALHVQPLPATPVGPNHSQDHAQTSLRSVVSYDSTHTPRSYISFSGSPDISSPIPSPNTLAAREGILIGRQPEKYESYEASQRLSPVASREGTLHQSSKYRSVDPFLLFKDKGGNSGSRPISSPHAPATPSSSRVSRPLSPQVISRAISPSTSAGAHAHAQSATSSDHATTDNQEESLETDLSISHAVEYDLEQPRGRYSLRTRQLQQVNPYKYEYQKYKLQLRGNPDAIVRLARNGHQFTQQDPEDGEVDPAELEQDEESQHLRRRRARSASDQPPERSRTTDNGQETEEPWYKHLLPDPDSSEDDDNLNLVMLSAKALGKQKSAHRKRKAKAFPMTLSDFRQSASPSKRGQRSPQTRLLPDSSDDEVEIIPGPSRLRKRVILGASSDEEVLDRSSTHDRYRPQPLDDLWKGSPQPLDDLEHLPSPLDPPPTSSSDAQLGSPLRHNTDADVQSDSSTEATSRQVNKRGERANHTPSPGLSQDDFHIDGIIEGIPVDSESETSSTSSGSDIDNLPGIEELRRMYPEVLVRKMITDAQNKKKRNATATLFKKKVVPENEPLQPGQTRVKVRADSTRNAEIRGDPESSDVELPSRSPSPMRVNSLSPPITPPPEESVISRMPSPRADHQEHRPQKSARYLFSPQESDNEVQTIENVPSSGDDDDPNAWSVSQDKQSFNRRGRAREGSLIDYMLNRAYLSYSRTARRKDSKKPKQTRLTDDRFHAGQRRNSESHHKIELVLGGAKKSGPQRQTTLGLRRVHSASGTSRANANVRSSRHAGPHEDMDNSGGEARRPKNNHQLEQTSKTKFSTNNQKKSRMVNGFYSFNHSGQQVVSGQGQAEYLAGDLEVDTHVSHDSNFVLPSQGMLPKKSQRTLARATTLASTHIRDYYSRADDGGPRQELDKTPRTTTILNKAHPQVRIDLDIPELPTGILLAPGSYLDKGFLDELLVVHSANRRQVNVVPTLLQGKLVSTTKHIGEFVEIVQEVISDLLMRFADDFFSVTSKEYQQWSGWFHSISRHLTWFLSNATQDKTEVLHRMVDHLLCLVYGLITERFSDRSDASLTNLLFLELQWSAIEWASRLQSRPPTDISSTEPTSVINHVKLLMRHMYCFDIQRCIIGITQEQLEEAGGFWEKSTRIAEIWVSLIHLIDNWSLHISSGFWSMFHAALKDSDLLKFGAMLHTSETIWRTIFGVCELSRFSVRGMSTLTPRLSASWKVVEFALGRIQLQSNPEKDSAMNGRALKMRDGYLRLLIARCLLLHKRWRWGMSDSFGVLNTLMQIFKSRNFSNLADERICDLPDFLRVNDFSAISRSSKDTAWSLLLKLAIAIAEGTRAQHNANTARSSTLTSKLLTLIVPVSQIVFKKGAPTTKYECSMIYNRLSAIAVALYLDHSLVNVEHQMKRASEYVDFKEAGRDSRHACIRGFMHLTISLKRFSCPLDSALSWLGKMTNILIDEYKSLPEPKFMGNEQVANVIQCIQTVLGATRRIIEARTAGDDPASIYPEPSLLSGPWVTRLFADARLTAVPGTALEIRSLVQSFLAARSAAIPAPKAPISEEESQESQDYGQFDLDINDPDLMAVLDVGLAEDHTINDNGETGKEELIKSREVAMCKIIEEHISPTIYRLLCQHFNDHGIRHSSTSTPEDTDEWIQCWVACANVLVQNGKRDWKYFLSYGLQSYERSLDPVPGRRVGVRFMLTLLQLDPSVYQEYRDEFIRLLLQSFGVYKITLEAEYASVVFTRDGLRHPLLNGLTCERPNDKHQYHLTKTALSKKRLSFIDTVLDNLEHNLGRDTGRDQTLHANNMLYTELVHSMLLAMQEVYKSLKPEDQLLYAPFCRDVVNIFTPRAYLRNHSRLRQVLDYLSTR